MKQTQKLLMLITTVCLFTTHLLAHTTSETTIPENNAVLNEYPEAIFIQMLEEVRMLQVEIEYEDSGRKKLDISKYKGIAKDYTFPVIPMGLGTYKVGSSSKMVGDSPDYSLWI